MSEGGQTQEMPILILVFQRPSKIVPPPWHDQIKCSRSNVHDTKRVLKSRMLGARIYEVSGAELFDATQTLKDRKINDVSFQRVEPNKPMNRVPDHVRGFQTRVSQPESTFGYILGQALNN